MVKELVFRLNSKSELESLIDKLEERIELRKASLDDEDDFGFSLCNDNRSFEVNVHPKTGGDLFEIVIKTNDDHFETITKSIFGEPEREIAKDSSILDIAEYLAELPVNTEREDVKDLVKTKFDLTDQKYENFKNIILKQATRVDARTYLKNAAERLN
ncbi:MAG: hypothetical protein FK733_15560 [Asgard group archaeon]|nr:hypothetical protein [Asgard group archaeon]